MNLRFLIPALLLALSAVVGGTGPAAAQQAPAVDRSATGGAQTLDDILARQNAQRGLEVDREAIGRAAQGPTPIADLPPLGGASNSDVYRALRHNVADVTTVTSGQAVDVLIQDSGMAWLKFREGPLRVWGGYALLGMIGVLALFYLLRGRIRIEAGASGVTITRFGAIERFGHWLLAGSFVLLGITGLIVLFGRVALIPLFGKEAFAPIALASKWVHNNVAWAFMAGLVLVTVMWIAHNIPNRHDLVWLAKGGGLFSKHSHPPSRKFNAGQKLIFWSVVILGVSVSASGLSLLFPFELPMFAGTFAALNDMGITALLGMEPLPTTLAPHQEMQLAQLWHGIVAFAMMVIIIAHIYIGSLGMEGAFDAMGTGEVDLNWAKEHHNLWVEEEIAKGRIKQPQPGAAPAE